MATAATPSPTLTLSRLDDYVLTVGKNFPSNTEVAVRATIEDGAGATNIKTGSSGTFVLAFSPPEDFAGDVAVKAVSGAESVSATFAVTDDDAASTSTSTPTSVENTTTSSSIKPLPLPTVPKTTTTIVKAPTLRAAASTSPSGEAMPVGDLSGWKQVFAEDFNTNLSLGSWPGAYAAKWTSYDGFKDTAKIGQYSNSILSVSGGALDMYLHTANGTPLVAAPVPKIGGGSGYEGQKYGRYSIRFKSDLIEGYKTAWLLWPDTDKWTSEIDFPEGGLDGEISAYNHCPGDASKNCFAKDTGVGYTSWHTATTEWTATSVKFFLDGKLMGEDKSSPQESMHWVIQTETNMTAPPASAAGHLKIDWVTAYAKS